ncbi:hypothetical protein ATANTOWER_029890, partial [Ataeniobius toweri]|nr:hypothetical protein [Ataeniobius toweri]
KNVRSGQEGSPSPCLLVKKILSIALRDQLTKSITQSLEDMQKEAPKKRQDTELKQGRYGRVRETEKKRLPPPRAERNTHLFIHFKQMYKTTGVKAALLFLFVH